MKTKNVKKMTNEEINYDIMVYLNAIYVLMHELVERRETKKQEE